MCVCLIACIHACVRMYCVYCTVSVCTCVPTCMHVFVSVTLSVCMHCTWTLASRIVCCFKIPNTITVIRIPTIPTNTYNYQKKNLPLWHECWLTVGLHVFSKFKTCSSKRWHVFFQRHDTAYPVGEATLEFCSVWHQLWHAIMEKEWFSLSLNNERFNKDTVTLWSERSVIPSMTYFKIFGSPSMSAHNNF